MRQNLVLFFIFLWICALSASAGAASYTGDAIIPHIQEDISNSLNNESETKINGKNTMQTPAPEKQKTIELSNKTQSPAIQKIKVIGNQDSKRYHLPGMKYYNAVETYHRVEFDSEADAIKAGYHKASK